MKNLKVAIVALLVVFSASACFFDDDDCCGCIDGYGPTVTESLHMPSFSGIEMGMAANVYLTYGPEQEVIVEGKGNIIDELDLDVRNGVWRIRTDRCVRDIGDLDFYITLPHVDYLEISGSGDIVSENFLEINDIDLYIPGSGNIDLGLDCDDINANISGSGAIYLEGVADDLDLKISGSGDFLGFDLECVDANVRISGSGNVEVRVLDDLDVNISGSGNVYYKGHPSLDIVISGSGDVIDAN